jgi:hypothetical protein
MPSPTPPPDQERAHIIAASALVVLALFALLMILTLPKTAPQGAGNQGLEASDIARFRRDPALCLAELQRAGVGVEPIPDRHEGRCGYQGAVRLTHSIHSYSEPVQSNCALAAALVIWERDAVLPASVERFGAPVARIDLAAPAYQCRQIAGRRDHRLSEHAKANAIDIAGFTLANGQVITVQNGWQGPLIERQFLRDVRNGGCRVFQAVLSPDYNRDHHNHLHFDLGRDKMCR